MNNPKTEEIVATLRHCATHNCIMCPAYSPPNSKCFETLAAACDRLEELSGLKAQQRWIPVTERLPEESGKYLIRYLFGTDILWYEVLKTKGKWKTKYKDVTHWMPLPERPQEAQNDPDKAL